MVDVRLLSITPDYMSVLQTACSKPYGKEVTSDGVKKIITSGHLSILEHGCATFEVRCSVRVLGQLTRHRHLSFTVKSARGSTFDTVIIPEGMYDFAEKHGLAREKLKNWQTAHPMLEAYKRVIADGLEAEDAAYFLPQGAETELVVTGNFRAWYEYLPKRLCKRAMPEHREIARRIQFLLMQEAPEVFDTCLLNCGSCTFSHRGVV